MRVHIKTLGCRLNEAELEIWAREFEVAGCKIVAELERADLLILNSCAVTQDAVRKSRGLVRKLLRENPKAKVILSGCYATLESGEAESLGVDLIVSNRDKHRLVDIALEQLPSKPAIADFEASPEPTLFRMGRHRGFIKVQDGCRHHCSYCIVTLARGEERSRKIDEILRQIQEHEDQGIGEVVLTGVHLGGYGSDLNSNLCLLIEAILKKTRIPRIRLGSLEPWDISEGFIELFQNPRLMPHLHLPIQSGSDAILKRMARRTRRGDFLELVHRLRSGVAHMNITTDIIVGFPGESDLDWAQTLEIAKLADFGDIHIFSFSPRSGTAAALMDHQVASDIKSSRSRELHQTNQAQKIARMTRLAGETREVLFEAHQNQGKQDLISGYTTDYHRLAVVLPSGEASPLSYTIRTVKITGVDEKSACLTGALCA